MKKSLNAFYLKILDNLNKNKVFFNYYKDKKTYFDLKKNIKKFLNYLKFKRKKIFVYSEKSFNFYSLVIAIIFSNNIFVPISKKYPIDRIKEIIKDNKPDILFYDKMDKRIFELFKSIVTYNINIKSSRSFVKKGVKNNFFQKMIATINPHDTAAIYYTSGSSGKPNGIKVSHINIASQILNQKKYIYKNQLEKLIFGDYYESSFSIFISIYFPCVYFGGAISPAIKLIDKINPYNHIIKNNVNVLVAVPSTIERINLTGQKINNLFKIIILTGEPVYLKIVEVVFSNYKFLKLFNCYGSAEQSTWSFYYNIKKADIQKFSKFNLAPIGKHYKNVAVGFKFNKELIVRGPNVANGYVDKNNNRNKFDLFIDKDKYFSNIFYTGDKVIKYKNEYLCLGRIDKKQLKINGYRIEINEIERNILKIPEIVSTVVTFKKIINKNKIFAFYFSKKKISNLLLIKQLRKYLPDYMIPYDFIFFKKPKINTNGKIDRAYYNRLVFNL
jgi:acyl-coenzyme A synthetase/AMP-(fatty) acid ligase